MQRKIFKVLELLRTTRLIIAKCYVQTTLNNSSATQERTKAETAQPRQFYLE